MNKFNGVILTGLILLIVGCGGSGDDSPLKVSDLNFNESKIQNCIDKEYVSDVTSLPCTDVSGVNDWSDLALLPNLKTIYLFTNGPDEDPINIDLVYAPNLEFLTITDVAISEINLTENHQLKTISLVSATSLESIDLTSNTQLEEITIKGSPAIDTILTGTMNNLTKATVENTLIDEFSIDALNLRYLDLNYNSRLSNLNLENAPNIVGLVSVFNDLNYVDFSPLVDTNATLIIADNPFNDEMLSYIESLIANGVYNITYQ
ncbi:hypothetical protein K0504_06230 [Neiella marina]|uniref:Uncharacterized protein n=1 Tax=Neiella holothuriorum TaxID=2870530 RepID=A0ABS7EE80_9GAMM|nr:hypothetical protein [Neiella holothuriorum]MBW8190630.1 hypothetical protein [Neiella holothuriorum]